MDLNQQALLYHGKSPTGKIGIRATKPMKTKEDLMLAYSPGVAEPAGKFMLTHSRPIT